MKKKNAVISINKEFLNEISLVKTLFACEDEITGLLNTCLLMIAPLRLVCWYSFNPR